MACLGAFLAAEAVVSVCCAPESKARRVVTLRATDPATQPAVTAQIILSETRFRGLEISPTNRLVPLGGVAHVPTVFCREGGDFLSYLSDRFGFPNADALWNEPEVDLAVVGDSFAQGACVPTPSNIPSQLAKTFPRTLNMGSFGNGPLGNLATIREYLPAVKPKIVLWLYVPNDLGIDLGIERGSDILRRYLLPGYTQSLRQRQPEVDSALKPFLAARLTREMQEEPTLVRRGRDHLTGLNLRHWLKLKLDAALRPPPAAEPAVMDYERAGGPGPVLLKMHDEALAAARDTVRSWGGQLRFVLVPDSRMFAGRKPRPGAMPPEVYKTQLLARVAALGIPTIDLHETFAALPRPLERYVALGGYYGHFDETGYAMAAEAIRIALAYDTHESL